MMNTKGIAHINLKLGARLMLRHTEDIGIILLKTELLISASGALLRMTKQENKWIKTTLFNADNPINGFLATVSVTLRTPNKRNSSGRNTSRAVPI